METTSLHIPPRLRKATDALRQSDPTTHATSYAIEAWRRQFASDVDLEALHSSLDGRISRGDVVKLAAAAIEDRHVLRRFFMGVMLWGFGTVGYGAARTSRMLDHPEAIARFHRGLKYVLDADVEGACLFFRDPARGALSEFGWAFITKFLYFVGVASEQAPMPVILDKVVARAMQQLADDGDQESANAMRLWWSSSDRRRAQGYVAYVALLNRWAADLGCRPDSIEMAMFKGL